MIVLHTIYAAATRWRRRHTRQLELSRPVVSIGNIAVGGRAKTPMVELVARALLEAGERPAILSRGYGRERAVDRPLIVRDAEGMRGTLAESGDEPLMLAERLDGAIVVVHADRARAGGQAQALGATVHVLDDGFQHLRLARDIDIVMLDGADLSDVVMPAGRLREPLDALEHADAIVVVDETAEERAKTAAAVQVPGARMFTAARSVPAPPPELRDVRAFFVSGVANHQQAFGAVRAAGWRVEAERGFKDHHRYTRADVDAIARDAAAANAAFVLTTAKDAVRLREVWTNALPLHIAELVLQMDEGDSFTRWVIERVIQARSSRAETLRRAREVGARHAS